MAYADPAKVIAKLLNTHKATLGVDDVLVGDNRVSTVGRSGLIVNASSSGIASGSAAQSYMSNVLIYCPDTVVGNYTTTKDGVDKAFAVAGRIDALMRSIPALYTGGLHLVNPVCTAPFQTKDPLSDLDVVSLSIDYSLVQGD